MLLATLTYPCDRLGGCIDRQSAVSDLDCAKTVHDRACLRLSMVPCACVVQALVSSQQEQTAKMPAWCLLTCRAATVTSSHKEQHLKLQSLTALWLCRRDATESSATPGPGNNAGSRAHAERLGSKQATRGRSEEAAHRGERDAASY